MCDPPDADSARAGGGVGLGDGDWAGDDACGSQAHIRCWPFTMVGLPADQSMGSATNVKRQ